MWQGERAVWGTMQSGMERGHMRYTYTVFFFYFYQHNLFNNKEVWCNNFSQWIKKFILISIKFITNFVSGIILHLGTLILIFTCWNKRWISNLCCILQNVMKESLVKIATIRVDIALTMSNVITSMVHVPMDVILVIKEVNVHRVMVMF